MDVTELTLILRLVVPLALLAVGCFVACFVLAARYRRPKPGDDAPGAG